MNRNLVIDTSMPFAMAKKEIQQIKKEPVEELTINSIVRFWKNKKEIKNDKKRKQVTLELLLKYFDEKYNICPY